MGFFSKLFNGPEVDMEKSRANANKMRILFNQVVENGDDYQLIFGYTEDVARFNYGFVHGSKTKIGNLIVGWNAPQETIVVVPTVPDLSGCGILPTTAAVKFSKPTETSIRRMPLLFIRTKRAILASTPMTGWMMKTSTSTFPRKRSWLPLPTFS